MIKKLTTFIFGNVPYSCESNYSLEESILRLQNASKSSIFSSLLQQNAVGKVSESEVRLQRVIPMFGNSFKPIFVGKFQEEKGKIYLTGKFTIFLFSKIFITIWLSFVTFWTTLATIKFIKTLASNPQRFDSEPILMFFPVIGAAFFIFGIIFSKACWRLSSNDIDFMKNVISAALKKNS